MNDNYIYFQLNDKSRFMLGQGWDISLCMPFIKDHMTYFLLLKTNKHPDGMRYNKETGFYYGDLKEIKKIDWNEHSTNTLCMIDFVSLEELEKLKPYEIAELLYFAHKSTTLRVPLYKTLENKYALFFERETKKLKIYFRDWMDFFEMFGSYVAAAVKNEILRKKSMLSRKHKKHVAPIPVTFLFDKIPLFKQGVFFTVGDSSGNKVRISFWKGEKYSSDVDLRLSFNRDKQKEFSFSLFYYYKSGLWEKE